MSESLLRVERLTTSFPNGNVLPRGNAPPSGNAPSAGQASPVNLRAVDDVSFDVAAGETVAIVGESGCGKSMTAFSLLRLVPHPGSVESGAILFEGQDLLKLPEREMRKLRGARISMIFQEPMTSLNPVYSVGSQIGEVLRLHRGFSRRAAKARAIELLTLVGIPSPQTRVDAYPHQLSGGMRQRVMIAMALACEPRLLLADEPTTALDVTIQAQILDLLRRLQSELGMSILFITHDLGVVAEFANRVVVMYAGRVVERASVRELFRRPLHPYTRGLLASVPPIGGEKPRRLATIEGTVPSLANLPAGCRFADRCALKQQGGAEFELCDREEPQLRNLSVAGEPHESRCHFAERLAPASGASDSAPKDSAPKHSAPEQRVPTDSLPKDSAPGDSE